MRANVDRQASLEDLAHVIRADSHLSTAPNGITDAADTIQVWDSLVLSHPIEPDD